MPSRRDEVFVPFLLLIFVLGFFYVRWSARINDPIVALFAFIMHLFAQFMPFGVFFLNQVSCLKGLPWEWHVFYAVILVLCMPALTLMGCTSTYDMHNVKSKGRVPVVGYGGAAFEMYHYASTFSFASYHYTKCMAAVIAYQCGFAGAWPMMLSIFVGFAISAGGAGYFASGFPSMLGVGAGVSPLAAELSPGALGAGNFKAAVNITRFTEALINSCFQCLFVHTMHRETCEVYASIVLSLLMAARSCYDSVVGCTEETSTDDRAAPLVNA